jgi:hypothetical protein
MRNAKSVPPQPAALSPVMTAGKQAGWNRGLSPFDQAMEARRTERFDGAPRRGEALLPASIVITEVDVDHWRARGIDERGAPCFANHRSAVSISALREGQRLRVWLTAKGRIQSVVAPQ